MTYWILTCLGFVLIGLKIPDAFAYCPTDWVAVEESGTCIQVYADDQQTWENARVVCQSLGGDLVKIVSYDMNDFVASQIVDAGGMNCWIGLHDDATEGFFVWLDETTESDVFNWADGQPDNEVTGTIFSVGQDCVASQSGEWDDLDCESELPYVCESWFRDTTKTTAATTTITDTTTTTAATTTPIKTTATLQTTSTGIADDLDGEAGNIPTSASGGLSNAAVAAIVIVSITVALVTGGYFGFRYYKTRETRNTALVKDANAIVNQLYDANATTDVEIPQL